MGSICYRIDIRFCTVPTFLKQFFGIRTFSLNAVPVQMCAYSLINTCRHFIDVERPTR